MDTVGPMYCTSLPPRYCFQRSGSFALPNAWGGVYPSQSDTPRPLTLWANHNTSVLKCHTLPSIRSIRPIKFAAASSSEYVGKARQPLLTVPVTRNQFVCTPLSSNSGFNTPKFLFKESKPDWSAGTVHVFPNSLQKLTTRGRRVTHNGSNQYSGSSVASKKLPQSHSNLFPRSVARAVCQYIDFLTCDNERRTELPVGWIPPSTPVGVDVRRERYYQEVMCEPITVPTTRFREWLRCEHNIELELSDMGRFVKCKTFPPVAYSLGDQLITRNDLCSSCGCSKVHSCKTGVKPIKNCYPNGTHGNHGSQIHSQEQPEFQQPCGFNLLVDAAYQTVVREELIDESSVGGQSTFRSPPSDVTVVTSCHPSASTWMDALIAASCRQDVIDHYIKPRSECDTAPLSLSSDHSVPSEQTSLPETHKGTGAASRSAKEILLLSSLVKEPGELSRKRNHLLFECAGKDTIRCTIPAKSVKFSVDQVC